MSRGNAYSETEVSEQHHVPENIKGIQGYILLDYVDAEDPKTTNCFVIICTLNIRAIIVDTWQKEKVSSN